MNPERRRPNGFTLIEAIVTLVIVAMVGTMLYTYSGSGLTGSVTPVLRVQSASTIHQTIERITADYQGYPHWRPSTAYTTGSRVTPIKRNGYFYQPTAGCTSGAAEPTWNTANGSDSAESGGGCTWRVTYSTSAPTNPIMLNGLATLRQKVAGGSTATDGAEGTTVYYNGVSANGMQYKIVHNRYIDPATSWDNASGSATSYLKVTIQSASGGERLTAIYTD